MAPPEKFEPEGGLLGFGFESTLVLKELIVLCKLVEDWETLERPEIPAAVVGVADGELVVPAELDTPSILIKKPALQNPPPVWSCGVPSGFTT